MALAAARSLHGRHGIRVIAVHSGADRRPPSGYSRHLELRAGPADETQLCGFLMRLADQLGTLPVLLPTYDAAVLFLHRHRRELTQRFRFYVWNSDLLLELGSKRTLADVAARFELPTPRTLVPRSRAELDAAVDGLSFPILVKPEFTPQWWSEPALALGLGHKAIVVEDAAQLRKIYDSSERVGANVVLQSIVAGRDCDHFSYGAFVEPDGTTSAEIVVRKLRIHPPRFGVASYAVTANDPEVLEVGRATLRRLGFRGFASVQLKRDGSRLYLLEIGLRPSLWTALAVAAGVDLPFHYYLTCVGEPCARSEARLDQVWMAFARDWRSMRTYARQGVWRWRQWWPQWLEGPTYLLFRWDDPLPFFVATGRWLASIFIRHLPSRAAAAPTSSTPKLKTLP